MFNMFGSKNNNPNNSASGNNGGNGGKKNKKERGGKRHERSSTDSTLTSTESGQTNQSEDSGSASSLNDISPKNLVNIVNEIASACENINGNQELTKIVADIIYDPNEKNSEEKSESADTTSISHQVVDEIKAEITSNELSPSEKILSVSVDEKNLTELAQDNQSSSNQVSHPDIEEDKEILSDKAQDSAEVTHAEEKSEETTDEISPEASIQIAPVEEVKVEEAKAEEAPVEEAPVEESSVEESPAEEAPVIEATVEESPVEESQAEEAPVEINFDEIPSEATIQTAPIEEQIESKSEISVAAAEEPLNDVETAAESQKIAFEDSKDKVDTSEKKELPEEVSIEESQIEISRACTVLNQEIEENTSKLDEQISETQQEQ